MSYLAVLTFDLHGAVAEDYNCVDARLEAIGFYRQLTSSDGTAVDLPNNTYAGQFTGDDAGALRDALRERVTQALKACGVHGRLFVVVCTGWTWGTGSA